MDRKWHFLSGDVNWRLYGGKWYRVGEESKTIDPKWKCPLNIYHVIEFYNLEEQLGEGRYDEKQGKYIAVSELYDLSYGAWREKIPGALKSGGHFSSLIALMKMPMMQRELLILEDMSGYSGGDKVFSMTGNNARDVLAEVMARG